MSDSVQLVPSVPVVTRQAQPRPEQLIEPARNRRAENSGSNESGHDAPAQRHLTISRHDTLNTFVYRSIDDTSGDVLWQYPAESVLRMSQHWREVEAQESRHEVDEKA